MSRQFRDRILEGSGYSNKKFECDFGLKLLQKMGWKGNGLGKDQQGGTECVQIKKRDEGLGLGVEESRKKFEWNDSWWENHYNNAVKSINIIKNEDSEHTSQQSDDSDDDSHKKKAQGLNKKITKKSIKKSKKQQESSRSTSPVTHGLRKLPNHSNYNDPKTFDHLFSSCSSSSEEEVVFKKTKKTKETAEKTNNHIQNKPKKSQSSNEKTSKKNRKTSKQFSAEEDED